MMARYKVSLTAIQRVTFDVDVDEAENEADAGAQALDYANSFVRRHDWDPSGTDVENIEVQAVTICN